MRRPERDHAGVAVAVAIGLVALLMFVAVAGGGAVGLVVGQRRAQSAADLAALAAALAVQAGEEACAAAARIAERHQVRMTGCARDGPVVTVTVELDLPEAFAGRTIPARARAGPGDGVVT